MGISGNTGPLFRATLPNEKDRALTSVAATDTNTILFTIYILGHLARFFSIHGDGLISYFQGWIILQGKELHGARQYLQTYMCRQ